MLFTCPSRYSSTIGYTGVFSLGGWSPQLHARFLGSGVTQELHWPHAFRLPGCHRLWRSVPGDFSSLMRSVCGSYNPDPTRRSVWALPVSLAATQGISFDFSSCRYLDVSVPSVCFPCGMTWLAPCRVSPFGHLGITACVQLPRAYRSLPRPSSPLCTQASSTCFRSLDPLSVKQSYARSNSRMKQFVSTNCFIVQDSHDAPKRPDGASSHDLLHLPLSNSGPIASRRQVKEEIESEASRLCGRATTERLSDASENAPYSTAPLRR